MYHVGICDDGINICSFIKDCLLKYAKRKNIQVEIQIWNTGEDLHACLQEGKCLDILFLDIELFELSGIEIGSYIRNQLHNHNMQIIYISGKTSYAQSLFKTQPMDFLIKPLQPEQIDEAFALAVQLLSKEAGRFRFQIGKNYYYLPYDEMIYLVSNGRLIKIVTSKEEIEFYGRLKEIKKELPSSFFMIHQSYIINNQYVRRYTYETVELTNGTTLTISKAYRKQIRQSFLEKG